MSKKVRIAAVILIMVVLLGISAYAASGYVTKKLYYNNISIMLNGDALTPKDVTGAIVEPFAIDGTTYLPVRAIAEALGFDVSWDGKTSTVIIDGSPEERSVYITRTGSKYHYNDHCNNGTYWAVPFSTATGMGLEPCSKCCH